MVNNWEDALHCSAEIRIVSVNSHPGCLGPDVYQEGVVSQNLVQRALLMGSFIVLLPGRSPEGMDLEEWFSNLVNHDGNRLSPGHTTPISQMPCYWRLPRGALLQIIMVRFKGS